MIDITYYTDPLCCWSWALEPQWRRLLLQFEGMIRYQYRMGGLLSGWDRYNDEVNSVTRPIQMGPVWMHAQQLSGMPFQHQLWIRDAPASSYPACIAVKVASFQSPEAGELYLRLLREALMIDGRNIAKQAILINVAEQLETLLPGFNLQHFVRELPGDAGIEAFRKDLQEVQQRQVNRFPALLFRNEAGKAILIMGYQPYEVLAEAVYKLDPGGVAPIAPNPDNYRRRWPTTTAREMQEIEAGLLQ